MTVENSSFPQFLTHIGATDDTNGENLIPTKGTDEDAAKPQGSIMHSTFRFISALIRFLSDMLKKYFNTGF